MTGLADIWQDLARARHRCIGFPVAIDVSFTDLLPFHTAFTNNIGDPESEGRWPCHTKQIERDVIAVFTALFGGSPQTLWGYVTGGGSTEGVLHGMWLGIERFPAARVLFSAQAHYSIGKAARLLRAPVSVIPTDAGGEMRYDRLAAAARDYPGVPAIVVATLGTTMTEAVDDIAAIHAALDDAGVDDRFIVVDAALSGPALALDGGPTAHLLAEPDRRAHTGADHLCFSAHKSFGTPHVAGVALTHRRHVEHLARQVDYLAGTDTTISGSRSGHAPLELAHVLATFGLDGLRHRSHAARQVAEHAVIRLGAAGWAAWRHPRAWTVVLPEPPADLAARWSLPVSDGVAHIVCAPGIGTDLIDEFVTDLTSTAPPPAAPPAGSPPGGSAGSAARSSVASLKEDLPT
jgi:histidine decarboxylase